MAVTVYHATKSDELIAMKKTTVDIDIEDDNPILLELHDKGIKP